MSRIVRVFNALGLWRTIVVMIAGVLCAGWLLIAVAFGLLPQGGRLQNRLGGVVAGDFMFFYPVGRLSAEGRADEVYDPEQLTAAAERSLPVSVPELVWSYPPTTSLPLAVLGSLPAGAAAAVWIGIQVLALLLVGRLTLGAWARSPVALFFPGAAMALFTGQISPLVAALLTVVVIGRDSRPIATGLSLGLVIIKPHYAVVPGIAMLRERRWPVVLTAVSTGLALVVISLAWFGIETWRVFFSAAAHHAHAVLTEAPLSRFVSVFSGLYSAGLSPTSALIVHGVVALLVLGAGLSLWRTGGEPSTRALGLVAATLLVPPYALDYDLVLLVLPWLLLIRESIDRPELARRHFWPWLALTLLVPPSYILPLYAPWSIGGILLLAIFVWMRLRRPAIEQS